MANARRFGRLRERCRSRRFADWYNVPKSRSRKSAGKFEGETVKTVHGRRGCCPTPLKRGVNEMGQRVLKPPSEQPSPNASCHSFNLFNPFNILNGSQSNRVPSGFEFGGVDYPVGVFGLVGEPGFGG